MEIEDIWLYILYLMLIVILGILFWHLSIPFWSESRPYCKAYDLDNNICLRKGTYYCLGKCEWEDK